VKGVIVNADDFGHSAEVNRGVVAAFEHGVVSSASLMVLRPAAEEAATHAALPLGLHVELGEWSFREGRWQTEHAVAPERVDAEVRAQLARFRELVGRDPDHLDSHQHVHREEPALTALLELGRELGVPVRHFDPHVRYCGDFYGQSGNGEPLPELISVEALERLLRALPDGISELCCHPGKGIAPGTSYASERELELAALCDPRVSAALDESGIELLSFGDLS
jgi:predicted glycoside hydrolase/deacetylase ChbG (UPF0249 family)